MGRARPGAMPFLGADKTWRLASDPDEADFELDLRGAGKEFAALAIARMPQFVAERGAKHRSVGRPVSVVIRIDPATPTSGETLFLPVGRQLLAARKLGLVTRVSLLSDEDGGGFHVTLPGHPAEHGIQA